MGLLDDAIREHLELRRLHGADPSEVAGKEHEALGSMTARGGDLPLAAADMAIAAEPASTGEHGRSVRWEDAWSSGDGELSQETAELDMRAVLADDDSSRRIAQVTPDAPRAMASAAPARAHS